MKAILKTYRQSPRKVRLVADAIRGKRVGEARRILQYADKRAAAPLQKLLESAIANMRSNKTSDVSEERLFVTRVAVDQGATLYRYMPRARGRSAPIRKRTSHIALELGTR